MKNIAALLIFVLCFAGITRADDSKYIEAMKKNIAMMDSLSSLEKMVDLTNSFLRIANAEKDKWLPYYYASYIYVLSSFTDTVKSKKDSYLDEADKAIGIADSLQPNESEIYVIKGLIGEARLQVDPMNRYMKYLEKAMGAIKKAIVLDPKNPRPEYLMGMSTYYTPEQFGGGAKAAKILFDNSFKKFNEFVPKNELMPQWGKKQLEAFIKQTSLQ